MKNNTDRYDEIFAKYPKEFCEIKKELLHDVRIEHNREHKQYDATLCNLKKERNYELKKVRESVDSNEEAIKELRRATGLKNGTTKGYSLNKTTEKLMKWSPSFAEEYNSRLEKYDDYNSRLRKHEGNASDWQYEEYNNRVDYAQGLTRDLIKRMKRIMECEFQIADSICGEED